MMTSMPRRRIDEDDSPPEKPARRFALLHVPHSGLFFEGGAFLDGRQNRVPWDGVIRCFSSRASADKARVKLLATRPAEFGNILVVSVELKDLEEC